MRLRRSTNQPPRTVPPAVLTPPTTPIEPEQVTTPLPAVTVTVLEFVPKNPDLTPGQTRLFNADRDRLFRLLDRRTDEDTAAVVALLRDLARQAPAADTEIAATDQRRRDALAGRPTIRKALEGNRT